MRSCYVLLSDMVDLINAVQPSDLLCSSLGRRLQHLYFVWRRKQGLFFHCLKWGFFGVRHERWYSTRPSGFSQNLCRPLQNLTNNTHLDGTPSHTDTKKHPHKSRGQARNHKKLSSAPPFIIRRGLTENNNVNLQHALVRRQWALSAALLSPALSRQQP